MSAIVLFDGVCNLCSASVRFIVDRDRAGYFRFASIQSAAGKALLAQHGIVASDVPSSIVLVENDRALDRSTAALAIARHLSGAWKLAWAFMIVPRFARDLVYDFVARNRYRWFGKTDACLVPTPDLRARFL